MVISWLFENQIKAMKRFCCGTELSGGDSSLLFPWHNKYYAVVPYHSGPL